MLQVNGITKNFGGLRALKKVSFDLPDLSLLGIIGPNGSGKSTLLNVISGFYPPNEGKLFFGGRDVTGLQAHQMARLGISRIFQTSTLFMDLSLVDNIFTGYHLRYNTAKFKRILRTPSALKEEKQFKQMAIEILEFIGLSSLKDEIAKNLPHGHQRTLSVGIALACKPKLLLLDEPMTGMNQNEIYNMVDLVKRIRDSGVTIIIIEHNVQAIMDLCDKIIVLNQGNKIAEGLPGEIQDNEEVIEAYLGKAEKEE